MAAVNLLSGESDVAIAPDSSGKAVRTVEVTTVVAGVPTVVEMQVMQVADAAGNIVPVADVLWFSAILGELQELNRRMRTGGWPGISWSGWGW